jgi:deoxyribodipyrimidine photo-lyase
MKSEPLQEKFKDFPWRTDAGDLKAWQSGQTGYPIVDAGMRQLWQTGWMHNRVRMIVGSLLVKHLLISWKDGEAWFWDCLVDADPGNNTAGWQWIGGCGADAAPYFRIFNPMTQGEKFNAYDYVRQYVPEIADLPDKYLMQPWEADGDLLEKHKIKLGKTYPEPIIGHKQGRERALEAFEVIKN